jgi:hypothetical protein
MRKAQRFWGILSFDFPFDFAQGFGSGQAFGGWAASLRMMHN